MHYFYIHYTKEICSNDYFNIRIYRRISVRWTRLRVSSPFTQNRGVPSPPLTEGFGRGRTPEVQAGTAPTVGRRDLAHGAGHTAWVTLRKNLPSARVGRRGNARYRRGRAASGPRPSGHRLVSQRSPVHVRYE